MPRPFPCFLLSSSLASATLFHGAGACLNKTYSPSPHANGTIVNNLCHIQVHEDKVANASTHYEEVEYLVGAKAFVTGIKNRKL